jgi:dTMP kinase
VFVTFEGVGGAGKTTQAQLLHEDFLTHGRKSLLTHEPGGTALGEALRGVLLDQHNEPLGISPGAEAGLFAASRSELVDEVIRPALAAGMDVVCDRYIDSSLAYQGIGRGLGVELVLDLNRLVGADVFPDVTFLLLVDLNEALSRRRHRDRIERADPDFRASLDRGYRQLAEMFPKRITPIDGNRPPDVIAEEIRGRLRELS